jgi:hypothetical protein
VRTVLLQADKGKEGQTDMTKLIVAYQDFASDTKKNTDNCINIPNEEETEGTGSSAMLLKCNVSLEFPRVLFFLSPLFLHQKRLRDKLNNPI